MFFLVMNMNFRYFISRFFLHLSTFMSCSFTEKWVANAKVAKLRTKEAIHLSFDQQCKHCEKVCSFSMIEQNSNCLVSYSYNRCHFSSLFKIHFLTRLYWIGRIPTAILDPWRVVLLSASNLLYRKTRGEK
jgi:hypothetical protein